MTTPIGTGLLTGGDLNWSDQGGGAGSLGGVGLGAQIGGALSSAAGAYYSVKAAQYQAESKAMSLEFQQQMSYIAARNAERDAQQAFRAGQDAKGKVGLQYKQIKASTVARQAAAGIQGGVGSAGEVTASIELAKESDQLAITRNSVRAANAARTQRVNIQNRGAMAGVSAKNLRNTSGSMNAGLSGFNSLLGSSGQVAKSWYSYNRTT